MELREVAVLARSVGFHGVALVHMVATIKAENRTLDPHARNPAPCGPGGLHAIGLAQICNYPDRRPDQLTDPRVNLEEAFKLFNTRQGLSHWTQYRNGEYKRFLAEAEAAVRGEEEQMANLKQLGFPRGDREDVIAFQQGWAFYDLQVDGILGPKTQEAIDHCARRGGRCGYYFKFTEFRSRGNGRIKVHRMLVRRLDWTRDQVKHPIRIQSGYRDPAHNSRVGGATASQHLYGGAADVDPDLPLAVCRAAGFSGIGIVRRTGRVAHVDVRAEAGRNTTGARVGRPTVWYYA